MFDTSFPNVSVAYIIYMNTQLPYVDPPIHSRVSASLSKDSAIKMFYHIFSFQSSKTRCHKTFLQSEYHLKGSQIDENVQNEHACAHPRFRWRHEDSTPKRGWFPRNRHRKFSSRIEKCGSCKIMARAEDSESHGTAYNDYGGYYSNEHFLHMLINY